MSTTSENTESGNSIEIGEVGYVSDDLLNGEPSACSSESESDHSQSPKDSSYDYCISDDKTKCMVYRRGPETQSLTYASCDMTLLLATAGGHIKAVREILKTSNCDIQAAAMIACTKIGFKRDVYCNILKLFLAHDSFDINCPDQNGQSLLHCAVSNKSVAAVNIVLRHKQINVNLQNERLETPLFLAAISNCVPIVKILLTRSDIHVNAENRKGNTAIHKAADKVHTEIVKLILEQGSCNINLRNKRGETALHRAVDGNHVNVVHFLLNNPDCDVDCQDSRNTTPLMLAVLFEHQEIVQSLMSHGCDVNIRNSGNQTALCEAAEFRLIEILKMLLSNKNCDVNIPNKHDETPLHRVSLYAASLDPKSDEILQILMEHPGIGKSLTHISSDGESILTTFITGGKKRFMFKENEYLKKCADVIFVPEAIEALPHTLALAIEMASYDVCAKLLERAPSCVNSSFAGSETALHCAIRIESYPKCKLLVDCGADLSLRWNGQTPLEYAISRNCKPNILYLLSRDIEPSVLKDIVKRNSFSNESPVVCAKRLGMAEWARLFTANDERNVSRRCSDETSPKCKRRKLECGTTNKLIERVRWEDIKKLVSTDLPADSSEFHASVCKHLSTPELIFASHTPNTVRESREITSAVLSLAQRLSNNISKSPDSHFAFRPHLSGSVHETTKTFAPNEVDVVCDLIHTKALKCIYLSDEPEEAPIEVRKASRWLELANDNKILIPGRLLERFYKVLNREIQMLVDEKVSFGYLQLHRYALKLSDKISCLQLLWKGDLYPGIIVHVDFVPCLFYHVVPGKLFDFMKEEVHGRHAIPKASRRNPDGKVNFDISTSKSYRRIMNSLPIHIKDAYIKAKALRITNVCFPPDVSTLKLSQTINSEDFITSHMLKMALFEFLNDEYLEHGHFRREFLKGSIYEWADRIYAQLETMTESGRWFKGNSTAENSEICRCVPEQPGYGEDTCCLKKRVVLSLCSAIRQWLRQNRDHLEHLSYSRHLVYSRIQRQQSRECIKFNCFFTKLQPQKGFF